VEIKGNTEEYTKNNKEKKLKSLGKSIKEKMNKNLGHRKRMRNEFLKASHDKYPDEKLLEMALYAAHTRSDTKFIARDLWKKFKHFNKILNASMSEISEIKGASEATYAAIQVIKEICLRALKDNINDEETFLSSSVALFNYCKIKISENPRESFWVFFVDNKLRLIEEKQVCEGGANFVPMIPSNVVRDAANCGASGVIICHNHPSGDPTPSKADVESTEQLKDALNAIKVRLWEHLVIGKNNHYSFKQNGLLIDNK